MPKLEKIPTQKELERKAGRIAEKTTHLFTSKKFITLLIALVAVGVGFGLRYVSFFVANYASWVAQCFPPVQKIVLQRQTHRSLPEQIKARITPIYTAVLGGKDFELPSLPDGFPKIDLFQGDDNSSCIGVRLREQGLRPKHPFIIVPGFVTSGLELWHGEECARKFFRKRLWAGGNFGMAQTLFSDVDCWLRHMTLSNETGLDVPGIHLRPAVGLEAVDYFVPGYAVWAKLVQALGDLGYDSNNLAAVTYDWRLAIPNLEIRDKYFSRLKNTVEEFLRIHEEKVLIASHSWGDNVFRAFLQWVDSVDDSWVEKHIATYINLAGPVLGVPKSIPAFLSGETRDTADMGLMSKFLGEKLVPARRRAALFRTWGAGIGMLPIGGSAIWGNATWAPDDTQEMRARNQTYGQFLSAVDVTEEAAEKARQWHRSLPKMIADWLEGNDTAKEDPTVKHHDMEGALDTLLDFAGDNFRIQAESWSAGLKNDLPCKALNGKDPYHYYYDPLKCPLPKAPSMSMYCLYGIGKPVERSYQYLHLLGPKAKAEQDKQTKAKEDDSEWHINVDLTDEEWTHGVRLGDGDGTVPLISTGLLCRTAWRGKKLNPAGIRMRQREYAHQPVHPLRDIRGGPRSSDHVDLLGNIDVMEDVLRIAAGQQLNDNITSNLDEIASRITLPDSARDDTRSWNLV